MRSSEVHEGSARVDRASERADGRPRRKGTRSDCGRAAIWLCGGALAFNLLLVIGMLALLAVNGLGAFWPQELTALTLCDGTKLLGEVHDREPIPETTADGASSAGMGSRLRLKVGNRDLTGKDFVWVDESEIAASDRPQDAVLLERVEWGNFYGYFRELRKGDAVVAAGAEDVRRAFHEIHPEKRRILAEIRRLTKGDIEEVNRGLEDLRRERRRIEFRKVPEPERTKLLSASEKEEAALVARYERLNTRLTALRAEAELEVLVMESADGRRKGLPVSHVVRALRPNDLSLPEALGVYASRLWEFVSDDPRESNTEGGIFPAIFGTVLMVFLMTLLVLPLGVLAAVYLREYARDGFFVRSVRIAVNNLAGVPSIVFGVFGLGFFVYFVGGSIDQVFYAESLPTPTFGTGGMFWASLTLALLTLPVVIVASEEGLAAVPRATREGSLALGATKLETVVRVVLPAAAPGVLTGMILAMARAAGEVAPLMIVGMVKLAPSLPVDGEFPFAHLDRKFMHLGFHLFDLAFQSPNVEAAKPLVFATALLLVLLVLVMNLTAISVRNYLRRKYASSAV